MYFLTVVLACWLLFCQETAIFSESANTSILIAQMSSNLWQVWADKVELMSSSFWRDLFTLCFVMDIKRSDPALIVSIITYFLVLPGHLDHEN